MTKTWSKDQIIRAYRELAKSRGDQAAGAKVFERETGIARYNWKGGIWPRWSAFQREAGFSPNTATPRVPDEVLLKRFLELVNNLGCVPTEAELIMKRKQDPSFPSKAVFRRWGSRDALISKAADYCRDKPDFSDALELLEAGATVNVEARLRSFRIAGYVYLLRSGRHYKIGRTSAAGRRLRELAIQLPQKPDTVHVIETDDPEGIEQYWHRRFADRRQGGEWFTLSPDDVRAFKKRRFQ